VPDTSHPVTKAGQALAGWNSRSRSMAETVVRIEHEAVATWLASDEAEQTLTEALAANVECAAEGVRYDPRAILAALRETQARKP
jgi:hypothetical protein